MPGLISSIRRFDRTSGSIPKDVSDILHAYAARANVILPHAEKVFGIQEFFPAITPDSEQFWLVCSKPGTSAIKFVLSCTEGPMGKYPIFIVPTVPIPELTPELLDDSMKAFCDALLSGPGFRTQRVYSVFSVDKVARAFAGAWEGITGIKLIEEPYYYDAIFTMCTPDTLVIAAPPPPSDDLVIEMRLAVEQDAPKIALLCEDFAATSVCLLLPTLKEAFMDENP
jgi:hypothetical protein